MTRSTNCATHSTKSIKYEEDIITIMRIIKQALYILNSKSTQAFGSLQSEFLTVHLVYWT